MASNATKDISLGVGVSPSSLRAHLRAPPMDPYLPSNWNHMSRSKPETVHMGHQWSRTSDAYLPTLWDKDAMAAWQERISKEKKRLGIIERADLGKLKTGHVRIPTLHGWKTKCMIPVIENADDFVPGDRGPFERLQARASTTTNEYGCFHRTTKAGSSVASSRNREMQKSASASGIFSADPRDDADPFSKEWKPMEGQFLASGAPSSRLSGLEAFMCERFPAKPPMQDIRFRTDRWGRTK